MKRLILGVLFFVPVFVFAEAAPTDVPSWLQWAMDMLSSVPVIGPILLEVIKYVAVVTGVMTAITTALTLIAKSVQGISQLAGLQDFAAKVEALYQAIYPYLAWLSAFNVQKKK